MWCINVKCSYDFITSEAVMLVFKICLFKMNIRVEVHMSELFPPFSSHDSEYLQPVQVQVGLFS